MGKAASGKRHPRRIWLTATAGLGLAGPACAEPPAVAMYSPELEFYVHLLVGGVVLLTALCLAWLVWLMVTCPPQPRVEPPSAVPDSGSRRLRAWIGARLGHPGPL